MSSIICGKCNLEYNNDKNIPIFLPCAHTFCKLCLKEIYKKNSYIICPEDGKKLYLAIDNYPINQLILKKLSVDKPPATNKKFKPQEGNKLNKSVTLKENLEPFKKELRRNSGRINEDLDVGSSFISNETPNKISNSFMDKADTFLNYDDNIKKLPFQSESKPFESIISDPIRKNRYQFKIESLIFKKETFFTLSCEIIAENVDNNKINDKIQDQNNTKETKEIIKNMTNYEENMIFSYFNVMKNIVKSSNTSEFSQHSISESNEIIKSNKNSKPVDPEQISYAQKLIKIVLIFVLLIINCLVISSNMFLRIYMFIILSNDTKRSIKSKDIKKMLLCSKRWLAFAVAIMIDECIYKFSFSLNIYFVEFLNIFALKRLWNCTLVIYVLLITGPVGGLNYIILKIIKYLNRFKLLLK